MVNYDTWNLNKQIFKQILNSEYEKLLRGELFSFYGVDETGEIGSRYFGIVTHDDELVLAVDLGCSDKIKFEFFEDSEFTGGTQTQLINKNRNSDVNIDTEFYIHPTPSVEGTLIAQTIEGTTVARVTGNGVGLQTTSTFLLKKNTKYLIKITTYVAADITVVLNFFKVY